MSLEMAPNESDLPSGRRATHFASKWVPRIVVPTVAVLSDVLAIALCAAFAYTLYFGLDSSSLELGNFLRTATLSGGIFIFIMLRSDYYRMHTFLSKGTNIKLIAVRWVGSLFLLFLILFLFKQGAEISRVWTLLFSILVFPCLVATNTFRRRMTLWLIAHGYLAPTNLVVIGVEGEVDRLPSPEQIGQAGANFVGPFHLSASRENDKATVANAMSAARYMRAEAIILAVPWAEKERIADIRGMLRAIPLPVQLLPDSMTADLLRAPEVQLGFSSAYELQREPLTATEQLLKRTMDLVVAGSMLVLLSPLMLIAAVLIKLDSRGPVLFRQRRSGFDGQVFQIYKFRTMRVLDDGDVVVQASRGDSRVTRIGGLLRASSFDELPQLLNVLAGHMSLVGPRPHALAHNDYYEKLVAQYAFRHHMKPGITGLAQVSGLRGETPHLSQMEARVQRDIEYVSSWSLMRDVGILLRTVYVVCRLRNAF